MSTKGTELSTQTKWKISQAKREHTEQDFIDAWERYETKLIEDEKLLPSHVAYCLEVGISQQNMLTYSTRFPEVVVPILDHIGDLQEAFCIENGIKQKVNPIFAMFILKAKRNYKDSPQQLTQNNYMNISPDVLADALKLSAQNDKATP